MSEPYLAEIKINPWPGPRAPQGWALCNGQLLPINQNQALFSLLGTNYGGNGQTNFALPNLQGRVPIHFGNGHNVAEAAGSSSVTINIQQLPQHLHFASAKAATATLVGGNVPAATKSLAQGLAAATGMPAVNMYSTDLTGLQAMNPTSLSNVGGSQPHTNMMPYLVLSFIIALQGVFPSQN